MLATGISTSMVSMAWGQNLYQTRSDGSIWEYTGIPCKNAFSCPGWLELDNNPNLSMIAAGGGALYEMHQDGSIWWYIGPACSGGSCRGWVELDNNPYALAIGAGANGIPYEVHTDGSLWEWNGVICIGGFCPGWTELSGSYLLGWCGADFGANADVLVRQDLCEDDLYLFGGAFNTWEYTFFSANFVVGANDMYLWLYNNNSICQYTTNPPTAVQLSGEDIPLRSIAAGGGLYQQRTDSSIWQYTGTPCNGTTCPGWVEIDNHTDSLGPVAGANVAGSNTVYQIRQTPAGDNSIWKYTGTPCSGNVCSGWVQLDANPKTMFIVAGPVTFGGPVTY